MTEEDIWDEIGELIEIIDQLEAEESMNVEIELVSLKKELEQFA